MEGIATEENGNGAVAVEQPKLRRSMGVWMATALVVGNMVGSGIFLLPASLAGAAGPMSIFGWIFTGVGAMLLALVFARLGRAMPRTGGPYAYARRAFGDFIGFQTAWGYWIAASAGNAAIAVAFVGYLAVFWGNLETDNLLAALVGIGVIIGVIGLFFIASDNFTPFAPHGTWSAISAAAPLTLWATIYGTLAATVVYILGTIAVMGVIATETLAGSTSPFADAAGQMFGGSWDKIIALVALFSTFGALNGWILLQGRVPLAAAEDCLFPEQFAKAHGERRTPVFGLVVSSVLVTGLMLMNYTKGLVDAFTFIILLATLTTLVPYAYSAAAQALLYFTERSLFERGRFARDTIVAALASSELVAATGPAGPSRPAGAVTATKGSS
jgi:basic amino acid/polyamine antiporter, APA family